MNQLPNYLFALATVLVVSCTAPAYDAQTDQLITTVQNDIDTQLMTLISLDQEISQLKLKTDAASQKQLSTVQANATYQTNIGFYNKVDSELTTLEIRLDSENIMAQTEFDNAIEKIRAQLLGPYPSIQNQHKTNNYLDYLTLAPVRVDLRGDFRGLLSYEQELKNGNPSTMSANK